MGQKTNASFFRLGLKNSEWNYKYIEKNKEESTIYLHKNIEIYDYIDTIFKQYNFLIHSCKINRSKYKLEIVISYLTTLKSIKQINKDLSTAVSLKEKNNNLIIVREYNYLKLNASFKVV